MRCIGRRSERSTKPTPHPDLRWQPGVGADKVIEMRLWKIVGERLNLRCELYFK
jgi:hypothetical protein